eukprot:12881505-Prorocentrum_lima.AAC.1
MSASPVAYSCFFLATLSEPENIPGVAVRDCQANAVVVNRNAHGVDHALESFTHDHLGTIIGFDSHGAFQFIRHTASGSLLPKEADPEACLVVGLDISVGQLIVYLLHPAVIQMAVP